MRRFVKESARLTRNPLGVVGLFIALVYGIAGLVLGVSARYLSGSERLPLIWFLVLFPFALLATFYVLVSRHHSKLYAPLDFYDKDGFFRTLTADEHRVRLDEAVKDALQEEEQPLRTADGVGAPGTGEPDSTTVNSLRQTYVMAEELALREIEAEFGVPVQRNLAVGSALLDGVAGLHGVLTAIEVKFVRGPEWRRRAREAIGQAVYEMRLPAGMPLLVALVTEGVPPSETESMRTEFARTFGLWQSGHKAWFKIYDLAQLKAKYGLGDSDMSGRQDQIFGRHTKRQDLAPTPRPVKSRSDHNPVGKPTASSGLPPPPH